MSPLPTLTRRLAEEHLEELSFLLLDRIGTLSQPDGVAKAGETESRIDAHLDGLRFAGEPALEHLRESLVGKDLELVQGASYALASLDAPGMLEAALAGLTMAKDDAIGAHRDALRFALHPELGKRLVPLLGHARARVREAVIDVLAYRREIEARALAPLLEDADEGVRRAAVRALAGIGGSAELATLESALLPDGGPEGMRWLLRLGSQAALAACRTAAASAEAAAGHLETLALAGGPSDVRVLGAALARPPLKAAAAEALGLLGQEDSVAKLLELLADRDEAVRVAAGRGLQMISGAGLVETFEVPEEETAEGGEPERTVKVSRASTDAAAWRDWLGKKRRAVDPAHRHRGGRTFTPGLLIAELEAPGHDLASRRRMLLELEIRTGQRFAYEPDDFGPRRVRGLAAWRAWWKANEAKFPPGAWTFGGAPIS